LVSPFATRAQIEAQMPRRVDWPTIVDLAGWNGLILSVHPALVEQGLCAFVPSDALEALGEFHAQGRLRRGEAAAQIARVSAALNAAGIEPLWLKGAALIVEDSAWANRRWMSDIDVWVAPGSVDAAAAALLGAGYRHDPRQPHAAEHHLRPFFHPGETLAVELHHALAPPAVAGLMPAERVLGNARRMHWRGAHVVIPGALDQAVHIASQARPSAAAYLHGRLRLRRVVEFAQLATVTGAQEAADALRSACAAAGQREFADEFLGLAAGMCGFPGGFDSHAAMAGVACKTSFPRLHSLYFGLRAVAGQGVAHHAANPKRFARNLVDHVRRSMDTRW